MDAARGAAAVPSAIATLDIADSPRVGVVVMGMMSLVSWIGSNRPMPSWGARLVTTLLAVVFLATALGCGRLPGPVRRLDPQEILVQADVRPTAWYPESVEAFGRVPLLTLYADGRVIYLDGQDRIRFGGAVVESQLDDDQVADLWEAVRDAGIERLQSHPEPVWQGKRVETADHTILRWRQPSGELKDIDIYADFTEHPEILRGIHNMLRDFQHEPAEPYAPEKTTLFVKHYATGEPIYRWPLDLNLEALFPEDDDNFLTQVTTILDAQQAASLFELLPRNYGRFIVRQNDIQYAIHVAPWLPGEDFNDAVATYKYP